VQAGDVDGARALAAAHDLYRELPPWWDRLALTWLAADLAAEVGDRAAAEILLPRLAPFPGHLAVYGTLVLLGPVDDVLGRLAALTGRPADGERHLRAAVTTAERTGLRACAAGALLHLAQLLSPDRPEEARTTAARAGALARQLGMDPVARRAAEVVAGSERSAGRRG
jgi:hypothetical protein